MGDLALVWESDSADLVIVDDDLGADDGLRTAVQLSLFTDRRAEDDDVLPANDGDRRGWLGDEFAEVEGDRFGSRLWLLDRAKVTPDILRRVEEIDREALAWMIEDRVTDRIDVEVEIQGDRLAHAVTVYRPSGPVTFRFDHAWAGEAG